MPLSRCAVYVISSEIGPQDSLEQRKLLGVAVVGIGNTKQWKTKRMLSVNYQEIFKIESRLVSYSIVIFMFLFLSVGKVENALIQFLSFKLVRVH